MIKQTGLITGLLVLLMAFIVSIAFCGDSIVIKGSTTVLPICQKMAEEFMKMQPDTNLSVSGDGSGNGIKAIMDKTCDIAMSSRFIKAKEIAMACEKKILPVPHRIAIDCIVPVVHPENNVSNITMEQLKKIYTGKIKNWNELGGINKKIVIISRDTSSGTYEVWHEKVLKEERVIPSALLQASNGAVAQVISHNKYAIGYIGIGYINKDLKALKINGVTATSDTALNGMFPVSRPLFFFTNGWPEGKTASFINFIVSPKGQEIVKAGGFVPLF